MATQGYNIRGRSFRTASDYQAALRDRQRIEAIEKRAENANAAELERLLEGLRKIRFETLLGSDFEEELEELLAQKGAARLPASRSKRRTLKVKPRKLQRQKRKSPWRIMTRRCRSKFAMKYISRKGNASNWYFSAPCWRRSASAMS